LKNALSGSAGENALFEKAKAELGPDATASEVAQRAQEMKSTKLKGRIEAARGKGYIPPPKSAQGSLGFTDEHPVRAPKPLKDSATDFNPEDMSSNFKQRLNDKMTAALA
jgi:hypothetical protein